MKEILYWFVPVGTAPRDRFTSGVFALICVFMSVVGAAYALMSVDPVERLTSVLLMLLFLAGPLIMKLLRSRSAATATVTIGLTLGLAFFTWHREGLASGIGGYFMLVIFIASFLGGARTGFYAGVVVIVASFALCRMELAGLSPANPLDPRARLELTGFSTVISALFCTFFAVLYARSRAESEREGDRAIAMLNAERSRLGAVIESTDAVILSYDRRGSITTFNLQAEAFVHAFAPVTTIFELVADDAWRVRCERASSGERLRFDQELTIRGEVRYFDLSFTPGFSGGVTVIATDITQRTRSARENAQLAAAIRAVDELIVVTEPDLRIAYVNPAFERITGRERSEVLKSDAFDCWARDGDQSTSDLRARTEHAESWSGTLRQERKQGGALELEQTVTPVFDDKGVLTAFVSVARDVTERRAAEARLASLTKQLVEASRQAGMAHVATGVLHNVGNVLNSVNVSAGVLADRLTEMKIAGIGRAAGLLRGADRDPAIVGKVVEYLELLDRTLSEGRRLAQDEVSSLGRNIDHIKAIIAKQQSFAKSSDGALEELSPGELMEDALRLNLHAFGASVEVTRQIDEVPTFLGDRHRILEILVNLLKNAHQAISAMPTGPKQIRVAVAREGERVRFEIADTGVGIPEENLTRVFAHGFTTRKGGHGFGLHMSAIGATEMDGSLTAHSDGLGTGATFILDLPLRTLIDATAV